MRFSELRNKELIDLVSGNRLGVIGEADLVIDQQSGRIISMIMPDRSGGFALFNKGRETNVPWGAVKKIGADLVIVELSGDGPVSWDERRGRTRERPYLAFDRDRAQDRERQADKERQADRDERDRERPERGRPN